MFTPSAWSTPRRRPGARGNVAQGFNGVSLPTAAACSSRTESKVVNEQCGRSWKQDSRSRRLERPGCAYHGPTEIEFNPHRPWTGQHVMFLAFLCDGGKDSCEFKVRSPSEAPDGGRQLAAGRSQYAVDNIPHNTHNQRSQPHNDRGPGHGGGWALRRLLA